MHALVILLAFTCQLGLGCKAPWLGVYGPLLLLRQLHMLPAYHCVPFLCSGCPNLAARGRCLNPRIPACLAAGPRRGGLGAQNTQFQAPVLMRHTIDAFDTRGFANITGE